MITISIIFTILFFHWVFDFLCQTDSMAIGKSSSNKMLTFHVLVYSILWLPVAIILFNFNIQTALTFVFVTFAFHWITDFVTSRIVSYFFTAGKRAAGFKVIGLDQLLHYVALFSAYKLIG